jgi:hypothetical protein
VTVCDRAHPPHVEREHPVVRAAQRGHTADHAGAASERHDRERRAFAQLQQRAHLLVPAGAHDRTGRPRGLARAHAHEVGVALAGRVHDAFGVVLAHALRSDDRAHAPEQRLADARCRQPYALERHRRARARGDAHRVGEVAQLPSAQRGRMSGVAPAPPAHRLLSH